MIKFKKLIAGLTLSALSVGMGVGVIGTQNVDVQRADAAMTTAWLPAKGEIKAGDTVYLGCPETSMQFNGISDTIGLNISFSGEIDTSKFPLTVSAGDTSVANSFAFSYKENVNGAEKIKYLSLTADENQLHASEDINKNSSWTLKYGTDATTITNAHYTNRSIKYNNGSPRFACYKSGQKPVALYVATEVEAGSITGLELDKTVDTTSIGTNLTLKATITPSSATNKNIIWKTSDSKIATVKDGVVTPVSKGIATITATSEQDANFTASCKIAVTANTGLTSENAFDISEALLIGESFGQSGSTLKEYYIAGTVKTRNSVTNKDGFKGDITDGTNSMYAYKIRNLNGDAFNDATQASIQTGYEVVIFSKIGAYNNKSQIQYGYFHSIKNPFVFDRLELTGAVNVDQTINQPWFLSGLKVLVHYKNQKVVDVTNNSTITPSTTTPTTLGKQKLEVKVAYDGHEIVTTIDVNVIKPVETLTETLTYANFTFDNPASTDYYSSATAKTTTSHVAFKGIIRKYKDDATSTAIVVKNKDNTGVVVTQSAGKRLNSISMDIADSSDEIYVYGSETAFTSTSELYNSDAEKIATITGKNKDLVKIPGNYKYFGFKGKNSTDIKEITFVWDLYSADEVAAEIKTISGGWNNHVATANCGSNYRIGKEMILSLSAKELTAFKTSEDAEIKAARATYEIWCNRNNDTHPYDGAIVAAATNNPLFLVNESSTMIIVIITISILSVSAIALLAIAKRKKATR